MPKRIIAPDKPKTTIYLLVVRVPHPVVKVGITSDIKRRIGEITQDFPFGVPMEVICTVEMATEADARELERRFIGWHYRCRLKGEWFAIDPEEAKASILSATSSLALPPVRDWISL